MNEDWHNKTIKDFNRVVAKHATGERTEWTGIDTVLDVLNDIGSDAPANHIFYPEQGGLDLKSANASHEPGCIELKTDGGTAIVRPKNLQLERFESDKTGEWSYFRLNLDELAPTGLYPDLDFHHEEVAEISPGVYDKRSVLEGPGCPSSARGVLRQLRGAFVIFAKGATYNRTPTTYDGRHSLGMDRTDETTSVMFRDHIENVVNELAGK